MEKQEGIPASTALKVIHAGSISALLRQGLGPAFFQAHGITVESEPGHSVALATAIREGRVRGDLYLSADAQVNQLLLGPANDEWIQWFAVFAYNSAVLAYSPRSRFLADFEQARSGALPWYEVLLQPGVQIRRNDPHFDPMGYYTLLVCALAQKHYGIPDLQKRLLGSPTNPEQVRQFNIARLESGEIDAMFLYRSAAESLALPYLSLPDEINLSNPALAANYAQVHFTTNAGQTFYGKPISFSAALLKNASDPLAALDFVEYLLLPAGQQHVQAAHFRIGPGLFGGDYTAVPRRLRPFLKGEYQLTKTGFI